MTRSRWKLQFSLATMLVLISIASITMGWVANRAIGQRKAVAAIRKLGWTAYYRNGDEAGTDSLWRDFTDDVDVIREPVNHRRWYYFESMNALQDSYESQYPFSPEDLRKALVGLCHLEEIWAPFHRFNDEHISILAEYPRFRVLLVDLRLKPRGVASLSRLEGLEDVDVSKCDFGDEECVHIARMRQLKTLNVSGTRISSRGVQEIASLKHLKVFEASNTAIDLEGVAALRNLPIEKLNLNRTEISDEALRHIAQMPIESLDLGSTAIDGSGFQYLSNCQHLYDLVFDHTSVGDESMSYLRDLASLEIIDCAYTEVSGDGLSCLEDLPLLRSVRLGGLSPRSQDLKIDDRAIEILSHFPVLDDLLFAPNRATDKSIAHFANMKKLRSVAVGRNEISESALEKFKANSPPTSIVTR